MEKEIISLVMSDMGKKSHKKSPRSKEYYSKIGSLPKKPRQKKEKKSGDKSPLQ